MMKPEEFISFEDKKPDENKWIIVTNNLNAQNAYSEMFHVWLVNFFTQGSNNFEGLVALDKAFNRYLQVTGDELRSIYADSRTDNELITLYSDDNIKNDSNII